MRDHRRRGAPDVARARLQGDAVGLDVAEEEELPPCWVVAHEERGGLVHAGLADALAVLQRHHADGHVGEDGAVGRGERESGGGECGAGG